MREGRVREGRVREGRVREGRVCEGACGGIFVRFGWGYEIYDKEPGWVDLGGWRRACEVEVFLLFCAAFALLKKAKNLCHRQKCSDLNHS